MEKEKIKKNIDKAVKVFREVLEKTYLKKNRAFYGIGCHHIMDIFCGKISQTRKSNSNLRICGELPHTIIKGKKGIPNRIDDWKVFPMAIGLFNVDPKSLEDKEKGDQKSKKKKN